MRRREEEEKEEADKVIWAKERRLKKIPHSPDPNSTDPFSGDTGTKRVGPPGRCG